MEDKYPLPNMADLAARLDGCTIFSKLDLMKGYLQVPVAPADVPKTAIITVPDHDGGRPKEVNSCVLNSYMVYL